MAQQKKRHKGWLKRTLSILGPGLITGASDDDPSGIATYSQAGAAFGYSTLWAALFTFPLMSAVQEMCARVGMVTSTGLAGTLKTHYPKYVLYLILLFSFPAIVLNIGADIAGMGAVANLIFPSVPSAIFSFVFTAILMVCIIFFSYKKIAAILKYLCITLLIYMIVPFMVKQNWPLVLEKAFVPTIHFNKDFLNILVALLGTTISPYLFFWQATMEAEGVKKIKGSVMVDKRNVIAMQKDVTAGMLFSNLVMFFIILTTASVLFNNGITKVDTVEQAAKALKPFAGHLAYLLFAIGVIGTGFLAIPVLSGSLSYMFAETLGWKKGLDKKFHEAKGFYVIIIISLVVGMCINFLGISPIKALVYTAVLYGLTAPVVIAIILHVCNNKKIMGQFTNHLISNIAGIATLLLMTAAAVLLIYFQFFSN
jgi:NRAMP (natural resistance-associated macrophage protein)-like metal ion transporter